MASGGASICVYCASRDGNDPALRELARSLGAAIAACGHRLVFGGGRVGLMGAAANAALQAGGEVVGVIPSFMTDEEVAHQGCTRLEIVSSMHERKARMVALSDGFCVLPGGIGTLDELMETLTWRQLGIHAKPVCLLDPAGYFEGLLRFLDSAVTQGFLSRATRDALGSAASPAQAIDLLIAQRPADTLS